MCLFGHYDSITFKHNAALQLYLGSVQMASITIPQRLHSFPTNHIYSLILYFPYNSALFIPSTITLSFSLCLVIRTYCMCLFFPRCFGVFGNDVS